MEQNKLKENKQKFRVQAYQIYMEQSDFNPNYWPKLQE